MGWVEWERRCDAMMNEIVAWIVGKLFGGPGREQAAVAARLESLISSPILDM
jgi:hypothetical protein